MCATRNAFGIFRKTFFTSRYLRKSDTLSGSGLPPLFTFFPMTVWFSTIVMGLKKVDADTTRLNLDCSPKGCVHGVLANQLIGFHRQQILLNHPSGVSEAVRRYPVSTNLKFRFEVVHAAITLHDVSFSPRWS